MSKIATLVKKVEDIFREMEELLSTPGIENFRNADPAIGKLALERQRWDIVRMRGEDAIASFAFSLNEQRLRVRYVHGLFLKSEQSTASPSTPPAQAEKKDNYGQSFQARYGGERCADCNNLIEAGQSVRYRYPGKKLCHLDCSVAQEVPYTLSGGEGYGCNGWEKGQVVKVDPETHDGHEFLYVVSASSRYIREDGMSFGVGDEQGYFYSAQCRAATDEESASARKKMTEKEAKKMAEKRRKELASTIREQGERPEGQHSPEGKRIAGRPNVYGGGDWFVLGEEYIWYVKNNGGDGDNWALNNVQTGGAGAIGWRVPLTQELVDEIMGLDT